MAGAIAGAFKGASAIPPTWIEKVKAENPRSQKELAEVLVNIVLKRGAEAQAKLSLIQSLGQAA
jgi:hypothetical protein